MFNVLLIFPALIILAVCLYLKQFLAPIWKIITVRSPVESDIIELEILEQEYLKRRSLNFFRLLDVNPTSKYNNWPTPKSYRRIRKSAR